MSKSNQILGTVGLSHAPLRISGLLIFLVIVAAFSTVAALGYALKYIEYNEESRASAALENTSMLVNLQKEKLNTSALSDLKKHLYIKGGLFPIFVDTGVIKPDTQYKIVQKKDSDLIELYIKIPETVNIGRYQIILKQYIKNLPTRFIEEIECTVDHVIAGSGEKEGNMVCNDRDKEKISGSEIRGYWKSKGGAIENVISLSSSRAAVKALSFTVKYFRSKNTDRRFKVKAAYLHETPILYVSSEAFLLTKEEFERYVINVSNNDMERREKTEGFNNDVRAINITISGDKCSGDIRKDCKNGRFTSVYGNYDDNNVGLFTKIIKKRKLDEIEVYMYIEKYYLIYASIIVIALLILALLSLLTLRIIRADQQQKEAYDKLMATNENLAKAKSDISFANIEHKEFKKKIAHDSSSNLNRVSEFIKITTKNRPDNVCMDFIRSLAEYSHELDYVRETIELHAADSIKERVSDAINGIDKTYSLHTFDLCKIIERSISVVHERTGALIIPPDIAEDVLVYGDIDITGQHIRLALENLLRNAADEIRTINKKENTFVDVHVSLINLSEDQECVEVCCWNRTDKDLANIHKFFKKGYSGGGAGKSNSVYGKGLGLYHVKEVLEGLGSEITCEPETRTNGHGVAFRFRLPLAKVETASYVY